MEIAARTLNSYKYPIQSRKQKKFEHDGERNGGGECVCVYTHTPTQIELLQMRSTISEMKKYWMELPADWRLQKKILVKWKIKQQRLPKNVQKNDQKKMNREHQ